MANANYRNESVERGNAGVFVKALNVWVCRPRAGAGVFEKSSFKRARWGILAGIGIRFAAKHSPKAEIQLDNIFSFNQIHEFHSPT
jgi:hypothetical protein